MSSSSWSSFAGGLVFFLLLLLFLSSRTEAEVHVHDLCKSTPHPYLCRAVLPTNCTGDLYEFGRYSVRHSLSTSRRFLSLLYRLSRSRHWQSDSARRVVADCIQLAQFNTDFLFHSFGEVNATTGNLPFSRASMVQSLLSAIMTNQETCLESLQTVTQLPKQVQSINKLYSVSLALVTHGWVPQKKPSLEQNVKKKKKKGENGRLLISQTDEISSIQSGGGGGAVIVVRKDGRGNFTTINDAVEAAPNNTDGRNGYSVIYVKAGVYEEYISIPKNKNYLMMIGDGMNRTIITGNRNAIDGWTTYNSATFAVVAPMFVGMNMTIRNTAGAGKHQAVALRNNADLSVFYRCSIEGYQDTLYTHSLRQFYRDCDIHGTVDFIFGNAAVVFQACNLYVRMPMSNQFNAITAHGRIDPNQNTGISILNCTVKPAPEMEAAKGRGIESYLGRPWKPFSRTVYMQSDIDGFISKAGWTEWSGNTSLDTLYYGEFLNTGGGSSTRNRVRWPGYKQEMEVADAMNFTPAVFIVAGDWVPLTGVPFSAGLLL